MKQVSSQMYYEPIHHNIILISKKGRITLILGIFITVLKKKDPTYLYSNLFNSRYTKCMNIIEGITLLKSH